MRWKIYIGDGSTFSDQDGSPYDAPGRNVQGIVEADQDHGRHLISGGNFGRRDDYFWWDADIERWCCGDTFGLWDYLATPGSKKVVFGRSIGNVAFKAIYEHMKTDQDFPPKTGWRKGEIAK